MCTVWVESEFDLKTNSTVGCCIRVTVSLGVFSTCMLLCIKQLACPSFFSIWCLCTFSQRPTWTCVCVCLRACVRVCFPTAAAAPGSAPLSRGARPSRPAAPSPFRPAAPRPSPSHRLRIRAADSRGAGKSGTLTSQRWEESSRSGAQRYTLMMMMIIDGLNKGWS